MQFNEIYRVEQLPVFQNRMYDASIEAKNCIKGDMVLVQDLESGLILNKDFKPELMKYDSNYQNEQAVSLVFQKHLNQVISTIERHFSNLSLVEIGCGKGHFLELLQNSGFNIKGFDPAYEGSNEAISKCYFKPKIGFFAEGIILRHVLEHIQNPVGFLSSIRELNGMGGKIYIEVPCFEWICENRAWFDIYYEHVNYFRLGDFVRMFKKVYEKGHIFGGQYIYVVADLGTLRTPKRESNDFVKIPSDFLDTINYFSTRINEENTAIWGAASKGVIFSLFMQRAGVELRTIIDINPAKQGKYLACSGYKVLSPEEGLDQLSLGADIFVMNVNYLDEIRKQTKNLYNYITIEKG